MIKFVAAIDSKRGIADENGIPWAGRVPSDIKYYRALLKNHVVIYGRGLYEELSKPYDAKRNIVASRKKIKYLREGFEQTDNAVKFVENFSVTEDLWVLGGEVLYESLMHLADELYLTQLQQEFKCTKFFPAYKDKFEMISESDPITENGITFTLQVWKRK